MKNKTLDEIRPLKSGVKLKRKEVAPEKLPPKQAPQVIQDVKPPEVLPPPNEEAVKFINKLKEAKSLLMDAMSNFNMLLNDKRVAENRSLKDNQNEQEAVKNLTQNALAVEELSKGEGFFGMCVLAIRQSLKLRDAGNAVAYKVSLIEQKLEELEKKIGQIEDDIYEK